MIILSHRGNLDGPTTPRAENSLPALRAAVEEGFGIELDVQRNGRALYVSHDPRRRIAPRALERYARILRDADGQGVALDLKSPAAAGPLERWMRRLGLRQSFLFDFELVGASPRAPRWHALRVSDLPQEDYRRRRDLARWRYLWVDEMEREWLDGRAWRELRRRTRGRLIWISPELHGRPRRRRWRQAMRWPIDGICTDYPREFQRQWGQRD